MDKFGYSKLMSLVGILLTIDLVSVFYVGQLHFSALIIAVWLVYFFAFAQFSTITAQVICPRDLFWIDNFLFFRLTFYLVVLTSLLFLAVLVWHSPSHMGL